MATQSAIFWAVLAQPAAVLCETYHAIVHRVHEFVTARRETAAILRRTVLFLCAAERFSGRDAKDVDVMISIYLHL
jgi:hypothetical protein